MTRPTQLVWRGACALTMLTLLLCAPTMRTSDARQDHPLRGATESHAEQVLDVFHRAAANARLDLYIGQMAPDGIFIGTDASERWTRDEFHAFCKQYFDEGRGWEYRPMKRHIIYGADKTVAWFDEALFNEKYGDCRGTGTLILIDERWKIAQYHLSMPIPNDLSMDVVRLIGAHKDDAGEKATGEHGDG